MANNKFCNFIKILATMRIVVYCCFNSLFTILINIIFAIFATFLWPVFFHLYLFHAFTLLPLFVHIINLLLHALRFLRIRFGKVLIIHLIYINPAPLRRNAIVFLIAVILSYLGLNSTSLVFLFSCLIPFVFHVQTLLCNLVLRFANAIAIRLLLLLFFSVVSLQFSAIW